MKGFQNISEMKCFDFFAKSIRNIFFRQTKEIFCLEFFSGNQKNLLVSTRTLSFLVECSFLGELGE